MLSDVKVAIDRGGTFTDVIAVIPGRADHVFKLLSVDPDNYKDANVEAIRRVLEHVQGCSIPKNSPLDTSCISSIRLGTTVATNALLERKGARCALLTTAGFKDILRIGDQTRPDLFAMRIRKPEVLYEAVVEIKERVTAPDYEEDPDQVSFDSLVGKDSAYTKGVTGQTYQILQELDLEDARQKLLPLKESGVRSLGICLVHGYDFTEHEVQLKRLALEMGFEFVAASHELMPMIKAIPRAQSVIVEAYLTPIIREYISSFLQGFKPGFEKTTRIEFMQSDGGLVPYDEFSGLRALLSGPAGGVVGEAQTCYDPAEGTPIVGFDMGGTSTDVSRYDGSYEYVFHSITAGIHVAAPQLDINTVAAGGGSILEYVNGVFKVGPESASSHPGPACYRKGGPLTITDANLYVGRILPEFFPHIFGPNEDQPLDYAVVHEKFTQLARTINAENRGAEKTPHEVALGFLEVANHNMAKPIRALTESRGHNVAKHNLASFGGAGGQNCVDVATILNMRRVIVHKYSSVLSAYGIGMADVVKEKLEPCDAVYSEAVREKLLARCGEIKDELLKKLLLQGVDRNTVQSQFYFNLGYRGSDTKLMIAESDKDFLAAFVERHEREFSFVDSSKAVVVHDIRVRVTGSTSKIPQKSPFDRAGVELRPAPTNLVLTTAPVYFSENGAGVCHETRVFRISDLAVGHTVQGPAILLDSTQTICVNPCSRALNLEKHIIIDIDDKDVAPALTQTLTVDPILLAVFQNRFMAIAEDMGTTLQKISVSANIKERMDFSCALFDADGNLTANAPHVPVHLGSMSHCIRYAKKYWGSNIRPGDVLASNHPLAGGTHLPDITLISPVFIDGEIRFFTASRAHHAEIGGSAPGSCAADATELYQEGAQFLHWKLVENAKFDYDGVQKHFVEDPAKYPGCSGSRNVKDNLSDLKAQIAANQRGVHLLEDLFKEYGTEVVLFYMTNVRKTAATAVRNFFKRTAAKMRDQLPLRATETMDDGSVINVVIDIDEKKGEAFYDFTGTSEEAYGPCNAPIAITHACIIYSLRLMLEQDIPLNEGCLEPVQMYIPPGSILNPSEFAAVAAANSTTSQRLNDCLLKAFGLCAASTGSNNTIGFGKGGKDPVTGEIRPGFAMVETIGGGSGACEGADGWSGVHCHMTNTKITDPEIFEKRYPVILHEFSIRKDSGGEGRWRGGDGLVRTIEFTTDLSCTLRTQRRNSGPYGVHGGLPAASGKNLLGKIQGGRMRWIHMPAFAQFQLHKGEFVSILTPGGGGYGAPTKAPETGRYRRPDQQHTAFLPIAGGSLALRTELGNTSQ
ncbi:hypothetical protein KL934_005201 [Ogataea polymorpha]|nr:hypothetical protein KL927_005244 [Ogataea polymorpha]KAG7930089.1 hypothetical protein KL934_005201 [Ogataea polymorpha]